MAVTRSNFGELLEPGIREVYGLEYNQYPEEYKKCFEVLTSTRAYEEALSLAGFGQVPEKDEGSSVLYADPKQGFLSRLTNKTYGLGFPISREMVEDELYNQINSFSKALAVSVKDTIETVAANVYNRAFNSSYKGSDGLEMCSKVHLIETGGTMANEPATAADLTEESIRQALIDIGDFVGSSGLLMNTRVVRLIVPPELDWQAAKILESTLEPESANNAINPAKGRFPYIVNHYLTDPDAWFLMTSCPNGTTFYWRRKPALTRDNDTDTENAKFKTTLRFVPGWHDFRGVYGSPGV